MSHTIDLDQEHLALSKMGGFYLQEDRLNLDPNIVGGKVKDDCVEHFIGSYQSFYEFSKIMEDEVEWNQLCTLFFERRKHGWEQNLTKKEGRCIGFYFNGTTVHPQDRDYIDQVCFGQIYRGYLQGYQPNQVQHVVASNPEDVRAFLYLFRN